MNFSGISQELLAEFAGETLFVLTDTNEASRSEKDSFAATEVYQSIPAVSKNNVFYLNTKWNFDDPITKERLLDELERILIK